MKRILSILFLFLSLTAIGQRVKLLQLERFLGDSVPVGLGRVGYVGLTDSLGDQHYKKLDSIIVLISDSLIDLRPWQYIDSFYIVNDTAHISLWNDNRPTSIISLKAYIDTAMAQGDDQYIDTFYFDMDTLFISLYNDGRPLHKVYLGTLISLADQDKQRFDSCFILADQIILSIQRDSVNAHVLDLTPYKQYYIHSGTTSYTNTLSYGGGAWTLIGSTYLGVSHDGSGNVTLSNNGMAYWQLNGIDDLHGSTMITHGNTVTFDGTGGLTAKLSASGSMTMVIDGSMLQWIIAASGGGTSQTIGDGGTAETVTIAGGGINVATISGNTVTITGTEVDGSITNEAQSLAVSGTTTGILTLSQANGAGGGTGTIAAAGINTINVSESTITITGTEVDGDPANELQTIAVTGTTTGIVTLSAGGGSFTIQGAGSNTVSRSGTNIIITGTDTDTDNYVDALTFSTTTYVLTAGRTGVLPDLTATVKDDDWWKVGTTLPPNNSEDARRNGLTGIGMDPAWILDVVSDSRIAGHHIGTGPTVSSNSNIRFGLDALKVNTGAMDLAIGRRALFNNTESENFAIGDSSLYANVSSKYQLAIGSKSLKNHTTNDLNLSIGLYSMENGVSNYDNTVVGHEAMRHTVSASYSSVFGHGGLANNRSGEGNSVFGDYSLLLDTGAVHNSTFGRFSMRAGKRTLGNVSMGYRSLEDYSDIKYNISFGYESMMGGFGTGGSEYNISMGYHTMRSFVAASDSNIVIGKNAGEFLNGSGNIIAGNSTLKSLEGSNNINVGHNNSIIGPGINDNVIIGSNQFINLPGNIVIANGAGTLGFKMLSNGFVGIGEATPTQKLHVPGNLRVTGAVYDSNNDPGTLGQIMSSTVTGWDWITSSSGGGFTHFNINGIDDAFVPTQINSGGTIAFQGTNGITAKLPVLGSGTIVIDGAGITGSTDLGFNPGGNPTLTSDTGADVIFQDGTGVDFQYLNGFTITAVATDALITNEGQLSVGAGASNTSLIQSNTSGSGVITLQAGSNISITESGNTITFDASGSGTNLGWADAGSSVYLTSSTGGSVQIIESAGIAFSASGLNMTISVADQSSNNEGSLTVAAGASNSSIINSNTPGSAAVTLLVNSPLTITESGSTITLGSTATGTLTSVGLTGNAGITVGGSPLTGSGGTMSLTLAGDLNALENMTTSGIAVRNGGAWTTRLITAGAGITIQNGDGTGGNPQIIANVGGLTAGNNITLSGPTALNGYTIAQPAFTSLATGFSNSWVMWVDGSGTPEANGNFTYNSGTNTMTVGNLSVGSISGNPGPYLFNGTTTLQGTANLQGTTVNITGTVLNILNTPTFADDAAAGAGGLAAGRVYKTAAGELRIKL